MKGQQIKYEKKIIIKSQEKKKENIEIFKKFISKNGKQLK